MPSLGQWTTNAVRTYGSILFMPTLFWRTLLWYFLKHFSLPSGTKMGHSFIGSWSTIAVWDWIALSSWSILTSTTLGSICRTTNDSSLLFLLLSNFVKTSLNFLFIKFVIKNSFLSTFSKLQKKNVYFYTSHFSVVFLGCRLSQINDLLPLF